MTATNVICQPQHNCVHLATDAAVYNSDGIVHSFGTKIFTIPHWPGVIAGRGLSIAAPLVGHSLSGRFATFDECVAGIEAVLPDVVAECCLMEPCQFVIVGWSVERRQPEAYAIETTADLPPGLTAEDLEQDATLIRPAEFKLQRLPDMVQGPRLTESLVYAAHYMGLPAIASRAETLACFRKIFEMQRHDKHEGVDQVLVGGFAQVTTVTPHGIEQTIIHRWDEDRVGELIKPLPVDWSALDGAAPINTAGLSRMQRERMEKKARKGTLRVVS